MNAFENINEYDFSDNKLFKIQNGITDIDINMYEDMNEVMNDMHDIDPYGITETDTKDLLDYILSNEIDYTKQDILAKQLDDEVKYLTPVLFYGKEHFTNQSEDNLNLYTYLIDKKIIHLPSDWPEINFYTFVPKFSFQNLVNLIEIDMINCFTINLIEQEAFGRCVNLKTIILPPNLKVLGRGAFFKCLALTNVFTPSSLNQVFDNAFEKCISLKSIDLRNVNQLGCSAFKDCRSLETVSLTSLTMLNNFVFLNCVKLKLVELPRYHITVSKYAFHNASEEFVAELKCTFERGADNRVCGFTGCEKIAQGSTRFCIAHGGGRRCIFEGCDKSARDKYFCSAHGGGKRCIVPDCKKSTVGNTLKCISHGGGRRCMIEGCDKSTQSSTMYCVKHGGGKRCVQTGCNKIARGKTAHCASHGGGKKCTFEKCNRVAIGKLQLCKQHTRDRYLA